MIKTKHPLYNTWNHMMFRCYNKKSKFYPHYGGRGIIVAQEWHCFDNFVKDMGDRPKGMSLDRIDNNGSYHKNNCRWASLEQQGRNKRNNILYELGGKFKCLPEWSEIYAKPYKTVYHRIKAGWPLEKALTYAVSKSNGGKLRKSNSINASRTHSS